MRIAAVLLAAMVCCAGCGTREPARKKLGGVPDEAFAPLTEDDIARLVEILPALARHVHDRGWGETDEWTARDNIGRVMTAMIERVGTAPGVDSLLTAHGTDWTFCRAMLWRLLVCSWVVGFEDEGVDGRKIIRSEPSRVKAKELRKRLDEMKTVVDHVPAANVDAFRRHYRDLRVFFALLWSD